MTTTSPTPCFIPPHLRKRTTTDPATSAKSPASSSLEPPAPAPKSPPSPPSSPELVLGAWDEPVPVAANAPPRNSKWPKQPPRRTPWPKNRDMRPVDHSSDGGVDCWENFSNGNSDPDRDVKQLIDWEGKWLPAPEQWNDRNGFTDRHFRDNIEAWINSTHKECTEFIIVEDAANLPTKEFGAGRELAPRFWIPVRIDGSAPQQFWESLPTRAPKPLSEVDLAEAQPWWDTYPDATPYLSPLDVPEARVDAREEENRRPGVSLSSIETGEKIKRAKQARIDRIMAKRNGPSPAPKVEVPPEALIVPDISLRPKVNIYLRPVSPTDVAQITDIYNYYVTNTIKANEFNARSHTHIAGRINDIINCGLPWIVAVDKALQPANHLFNFVHEKIVGFVSLDDHCDPGSMYRFTYEMEMFVHPGYLNKGVGKCLLDRLLSIVNTGYTAKRGYEWRCPGEYLRNDAGRVIKTINVTVPLDHDNVDEIKWVTAFFRAFDFRKSGHLMKMAYKLGKTVDVCIYQHHTTEEINSNAIPQRPL
ncbi:hypothetical protein BDV95DRAFT_269174 [Massariosphaeria phaeospora]|uniref:N-acetyltransferase domain-containing protein n=1 Tax=Massariosphaeria phaeospora TaxID=100035 RepID=A0A7C8LZT7_9PLEO|nr:hypothetical protein BDV95DRAFT_269174 [Massariosphaeria phaeospora]